MTTAYPVSSVPPIAGPPPQSWRFNGPAAFPPGALTAVSLSGVSLLASALFGTFASGSGATAVAAIVGTLGTFALIGACLALFGLSYAFRAKSLTLLLLSVVALALNAALLRHTIVLILFSLSSVSGHL